MTDTYISPRKLLTRGKSSGLQVVTVGKAKPDDDFFVAILYSRTEKARFAGRGDTMIAAVTNAVSAFNAGHCVPKEAEDLAARIVAAREDERPRIIVP